MIEMLIKAAILILVLALVFFGVVWALSLAGIVLPQFVVGVLVGLCILVALLWLWRNRGSLGL